MPDKFIYLVSGIPSGGCPWKNTPGRIPFTRVEIIEERQALLFLSLICCVFQLPISSCVLIPISHLRLGWLGLPRYYLGVIFRLIESVVQFLLQLLTIRDGLFNLNLLTYQHL